MAVVTSVAIGAVGVGMSAYQAYSGSKQAEQARKDLENQPVQELKNSYRDLNVTRYGADLKQEAQQNLAASQVEALQGAGVRGVVGGLGRVEAGNQAVAQEIGADLDAQRKAIDQAIASGDMTVQQIEEQRRRENLAALSSQFSAGQQQQYQGLQGMFQSAAAAASGYAQLKGLSTAAKSAEGFKAAGSAVPSSLGLKVPTPKFPGASNPLSSNINQGFASTPVPLNYSGFGSIPNMGQTLYNQQYVE